MKKYATSLISWRGKQIKSFEEQILLYLNIYEKCLHVSRFFAENLVNHYDLKLDNIFIDAPNLTYEISLSELQ
jgi:hypothetical protein